MSLSQPVALHDPTSPLGELLIKAEKDRNLRRGEAADMLGVSRSAYGDWKKGTNPGYEHLAAVSAFCKEPVRVILRAIGIDVDTTYSMPDIPGYRTPLRVIK